MLEAMEEFSVYIQSLSKTVEIPFAQLTPSVPKAKDTVVVISGENREMQGELIGIDEKDCAFRGTAAHQE